MTGREISCETDGYVFYASFHESTKDLDDIQYGKLMKAINEYAFYGITPPDNLPGIIKMAFGLIKPQIDANKRKREEYIRDTENGKKGGAPKGNKNAKKQPKQPPVVLENNPPLFPETTPKTTINGNGNGNVNVKENGNGTAEKQSAKQPPPLSFSEIKNNITQKGYFIDDDKSLERLIAGTDPSWFHGRSFIDFIAETVQDGYADKPKRERHNIFRKLLFDAANLRDEYPEWRRQQEQADIDKEKRKDREQAFAARPTTCPVCGGELNEKLLCQKHGFFEFNEARLKYEFQETEEIDFAESFRNKIQGRKP